MAKYIFANNVFDFNTTGHLWSFIWYIVQESGLIFDKWLVQESGLIFDKWLGRDA